MMSKCLKLLPWPFIRYILYSISVYPGSCYYRPQTKLREGNVFRGVCVSTGVSVTGPCSFRGSLSGPLDRDLPGRRPPPRQRPHRTETPPPTTGQILPSLLDRDPPPYGKERGYASYLNAFLITSSIKPRIRLKQAISFAVYFS